MYVVSNKPIQGCVTRTHSVLADRHFDTLAQRITSDSQAVVATMLHCARRRLGEGEGVPYQRSFAGCVFVCVIVVCCMFGRDDCAWTAESSS